jgi:hypothetical protein
MNEEKNFTRVKMKCINSLPPMPHHSHFKHNEDVLVKFKSGFYTIGRIRSLDQGPMWAGGPRIFKLMVLFRTPRGGRSYELSGQEVTIPPEHRASAGLHRIQSILGPTITWPLKANPSNLGFAMNNRKHLRRKK